MVLIGTNKKSQDEANKLNKQKANFTKSTKKNEQKPKV